MSGPMAQHVGWRNWWWLNVALTGLSFIMVVFMFPETKWDRTHQVKVEKDLKQSVSNPQEVKESETKVESNENGVNRDLTTVDTAARDPYLGKGKPEKFQWRLYQPNSTPFQSIFLDLWIPWKLFVFPIVEFASFVVSWSCSSFLTLVLTQSQAFAAPPYNYSSQNIGLSIQDHSKSSTDWFRVHELFDSCWSFYWSCNCGPTFRLGFGSSNSKK
jgi:hypothetical protein